MDEALLPCPFCGSETVLLSHTATNMAYVSCCRCDASGDCFDMDFEAITAWNTRATPVVKQSLTADVTETGDAIINGFILAAFEAGRVAGLEWQPIETAPKDGTPFVAATSKFSYRTSAGRIYVKWPHEEGGPTFQDVWNAEDSGSIWPWKPTHWMPLPTPPSAH